MRNRVLATVASLLVASCGRAPELAVKDVWARDTIGGTANAAVFMTIVSPSADRLVAASTPAAKKTDLMTMVGGGAAMGMTYVDGIDIPAGQPVSLNAGGLHVWLADLAQPLKTGESIPLTLKFEHAGERQVSVSVVVPAAAGPMQGM